MKKVIIPLMALWFLSACSKEDLAISFRMDYEQEVVIPSSVGVNLPFTIQSPPVKTNSSSTFSSRNTSAERVSEVSLEEMTLNLESPSGEDFSFLESIYILISAEGLPKDTIAWSDPVPAGAGASLNLNTTQSNLKPYLVKDEYQLETTTVTDEVIAQEHRITIKSVFRVSAQVFE